MTVPPPSAASLDLAKYIPWIITGVGIASSLIWNFINYRKTTNLQKRIRADTVKLEEFRRIRTQIDVVMTEIGNDRANLAALANSSNPIDDWRKEFTEIHKKIVLNYLRLQDGLQRANTSQYTSHQNWASDVDPMWESFSSIVDRAQNQTRPETEARSAAGLAAAKIGELLALVDAKSDAELLLYTSQF